MNKVGFTKYECLDCGVCDFTTQEELIKHCAKCPEVKKLLINRMTLQDAIQKAEEWCGYDAYETDYDKSTDEHTCDRCRGVNCSADELLDFLKTLEK